MKVQVGRFTYKLYDCDPQRLSSPANIWRLLRGAARESWKTRLADCITRLPDGGISGFVQLDEMHIAIHTRPPQRYAEISFSLGDPRCAPEGMGLFFTEGLASSFVQTDDAWVAFDSRRMTARHRGNLAWRRTPVLTSGLEEE